MTLKKVFILDGPAESMEKIIRNHYEEGNLEIRSSDSDTEFRRHLPETYDLYLLHLSNTKEEAIRELKEMQPWCKIFVRDSMRQELPPLLVPLIDGRYSLRADNFYEIALKSIGMQIKTKEEVFGGATRWKQIF